jgi:hypothetical protein
MGDRTLHRLLKSRLGLSFLGRLRSDLEKELVRVAGKVYAMPVGARP